MNLLDLSDWNTAHGQNLTQNEICGGNDQTTLPAAAVAIAVTSRIALARTGSAYSCRMAGVSGRTICANFAASQLVNRMQPCDAVRPMVSGSGVP